MKILFNIGDNNLKEFWKDIENFEGKYQVSNKGQIKRTRTLT